LKLRLESLEVGICTMCEWPSERGGGSNDERIDAGVRRGVARQVVGREGERVKAFERDELAGRQRDAQEGRLGLRERHVARRWRPRRHSHADGGRGR